MKKKYIIVGAIGLALGVGLWFIIKGNKQKRVRKIQEGSFTIEVEEDETPNP